ncbi:SDR family NAD(P)-dependent oxidoreductase [Microbacterium sp. E-13]|uniref:SDR family NAD(P)-dependent oxidoreductase n=1 Tax=Microbacterium sp. E-13 TaxID=3404048 RepID=UPI003CE8EADF
MISLDLGGKRALVTGATRGLGFAMATRLAQAGALVGVNGRSAQSVTTALRDLRDAVPDGTFVGVVADLASEEGAASAVEQFPDADILINNIGIYHAGEVLDTPASVWADHYDANVLTGVRITRNVLPGMLARRWGRVVFIASDAAVAIPTDMVHYAASKTAILAVARGFAKATAGSGITVNSVIVGPSETDGLKGFVSEVVGTDLPWDQAQAEFMRVHRPLSIIQRLIRPEEVANMVVYLSSELSSATTGGALRVDGGYVDAILP